MEYPGIPSERHLPWGKLIDTGQAKSCPCGLVTLSANSNRKVSVIGSGCKGLSRSIVLQCAGLRGHTANLIGRELGSFSL